MPDKLLMATSQGDGERLKYMLNKEDAAATASGNLATIRKQPTPATINPVLLGLACSGDSAGLDFLVNNRVATQAQAQEIRGNLAWYTSSNGGSDDVEEGGRALPAPSSLLEGVTVEGDTALHAVATCGRGDNFLRSADIIHRKARNLLFVQNKKGDTPVHCAARAGNLKMVSWLIHLAKLGEEDMNAAADRVKSLLEKENKLKETALHEAVRIERVDSVERLMKEDQDLAGFPRTGRTSPLYLAILLKNKDIVDKLYEMSGGGMSLSYSGPNGQNALHAAATRGQVLTEKLLKWNKALSAQKDETGSMPLHFATAKSPNSSYSTQFHDDLHKWRKSHSTITTQVRKKLVSLLRMRWPRVCLQLLEANPAALYEPDHRGSYPIHVATSVGATRKVLLFLDKHPSSAGLRDARGRTFLHVAVEKMAVGILYHATRYTSLAWILNMRDKDGNTAMHLAVKGGRLRTFCRLLGNRKILLNLPNAEGETCLDLACHKVPPGLYYSQNSEACIRRALAMVGALSGTSREDLFGENYEKNHRLKPEEENREAESMKEATQTLSIGSVLIATVTFGATFALPGGYKADDHPNGGSPTLAGTYAFDAFMMANTLAFICASMATVGFMFSRTPMVNRRSRKFHLRSSVYFMEASVTSLTATFALGIYMVLAPVAYKTAVAVCAVSPFALLWKNVDYWKRWLRFAGPFWVRKGLFWTLQEFVRQFVWNILVELWPLVIIFCWAAFANTSTHF